MKRCFKQCRFKKLPTIPPLPPPHKRKKNRINIMIKLDHEGTLEGPFYQGCYEISLTGSIFGSIISRKVPWALVEDHNDQKKCSKIVRGARMQKRYTQPERGSKIYGPFQGSCRIHEGPRMIQTTQKGDNPKRETTSKINNYNDNVMIISGHILRSLQRCLKDN